MEQTRSRLDPSEPNPLGKGNGPSEGIIGKSLGQTTSTQEAKDHQAPYNRVNADGNTGNDAIDNLDEDHSSPHKGELSSVETKATEVPNLDEKAFGTRAKPRTRSSMPNMKVAKTIDEEDLETEMPPSDQAAVASQCLNQASHKSSCLSSIISSPLSSPPSSPLEELDFSASFETESTKSKAVHGESSMITAEHSPEMGKASRTAAGRRIVESPVSPFRKPARFSRPVPSPARSRPPSIARSKRIYKAKKPLVPRNITIHDEIAQLRRDTKEFEKAYDELTMANNKILLLRGGPRPFPMIMSQFEVCPVSRVSRLKRPASDNDEGRASRKPRSSPNLEDSQTVRSFSMHDTADVDPSTLCPYCDEPWPSSPSSRLLSLLEVAKRKSYKEPRPGNRLGLTAPFSTYVEVCQRHRFEMTQLPLALQRGWPTHLDFPSLPKRIKSFKEELTQLIAKPESSKFWRDLRDDVKQVGRTKMVSVSGQYATFERTQPGYYGEQGSVIIHQTLYSLFPPDLIPEESVDPLTPDQFVTYVLVPETAVLLIKSDMNLPSNEDAWEVMEESKKYGMAMFPEQGQDETVAEVGERLARERAMLQRKILEERGEADDDVRKQIEEERYPARKTRRKGKATIFDTEMDAGCSYNGSKRKTRVPGRQSEVPLTAQKTRPKARMYKAATPVATWKRTSLPSVSPDGTDGQGRSQPSSIPRSVLSSSAKPSVRERKLNWLSCKFNDGSDLTSLSSESDILVSAHKSSSPEPGRFKAATADWKQTSLPSVSLDGTDEPECPQPSSIPQAVLSLPAEPSIRETKRNPWSYHFSDESDLTCLSSESDALVSTDDPTPDPRVEKPALDQVNRTIVTGDSKSDAPSEVTTVAAAQQSKPATLPKGRKGKKTAGMMRALAGPNQLWVRRSERVRNLSASQQSQS